MTQIAERTSTIISLWPKIGFSSNRPSGYYQIDPCPRCEKHSKVPCKVCRQYAKTSVGKRFEWEDVGDQKARQVPIDDRDLAMDLASGVSNYGVLAIEGAEPSNEELDIAFANLEAYLRHTLDHEDRVYGVTGKHYNVEHAMIAADYFGEKRDWQIDTTPKVSCPVCATPNLSSAIKCGNFACGAILDWTAARDNGLLTERQEQIGLATGKLKPLPAVQQRKMASQGAEL